MPESIPLRTKRPRSHAPALSNDISLEDSGRSSSPVVVSGLSSRQLSRTSSPFTDTRNGKASAAFKEPDSPTPSDLDFDDWDENDASMPSDLRPELEEERDGHRAPLLGNHAKDEGEGIEEGLSRRSTHHFHERDPETQAKYETRKKYTYAAITLALSLVSFTVQTETAVYIQHQLKWEKPYCML
jgi:hypothetical protein